MAKRTRMDRANQAAGRGGRAPVMAPQRHQRPAARAPVRWYSTRHPAPRAIRARCCVRYVAIWIGCDTSVCKRTTVISQPKTTASNQHAFRSTISSGCSSGASGRSVVRGTAIGVNWHATNAIRRSRRVTRITRSISRPWRRLGAFSRLIRACSAIHSAPLAGLGLASGALLCTAMNERSSLPPPASAVVHREPLFSPEIPYHSRGTRCPAPHGEVNEASTALSRR